MAQTIKGTPDTFSPVYNPVFFYIDSTNKNNEGFKYIVDVFSSTGSTRLDRFKLFPRPYDGYGVADVNQVLACQVGTFFNQNLNGFSYCDENFFNYKISFGEEYVFYVPFDIPSNWLGYQAFSSTTNTYNVGGFQLDDEIILSGNVSSINGTYTVLATGSDYIVLNTPYDSASSGLTACTIVYANKRKTLFTGETQATGYTVWNGAIGHQSFIDYSSTTYSMNVYSQNKQFLTDVPNTYTVRPENQMWLNYYSANANHAKYLKVITNNGTFLFANPLTASTMATVAVGIYNLNNFDSAPIVSSGSLPMFDDNTTSYSVQLVDIEETFLPVSEVKTFTVKQKCFKYTNVELLFVDRKGSYIPVNFELNSIRNINVSKSEYSTILGNLSGNKWSYNSTDGGKRVLNTTVIEQLDVQTDWQTEAESNFFQQIVSSPRVYIKENGKYWPVLVRTTDLPVLNKNNKKNINQRLLIEYANNNRIQSF